MDTCAAITRVRGIVAVDSRKLLLLNTFKAHIKVKPWSQDWLIAAGAYPGFCSMKRLEVFPLPLDKMLVHRRSLLRNLLGFPNNSPVPIIFYFFYDI